MQPEALTGFRAGDRGQCSKGHQLRLSNPPGNIRIPETFAGSPLRFGVTFMSGFTPVRYDARIIW